MRTKAFKGAETLSANSASTYYTIIISVIKEATQSGHIDPSVLKTIGSIKRSTITTEALSRKEFIRMAETECDSLSLKKAFLLSALTGLCWNEINVLSRHHIEATYDNTYQLNLRDVDNPRTIPLTLQGYKLLF